MSKFHGIAQSITASLATLNSCIKGQNWDELYARSYERTEYTKLLRSAECSLMESLHDVRVALNMLAPINRLPTDILRSIFDRLSPPPLGGFLPLVQYTPWMGDGPTPQLDVYRWLRIISVCRHWRNVALSSSTAWTTITIGPTYTPSHIVDFQLRHSDAAPLDFHAWPEGPAPEILRRKRFRWDNIDLRPLIPRLRSFHLHFAHFDMVADHFFDQLTSPAPLLEHLTVAPVSFPSLTLPHEEDSMQFILPKLFEDSMPRLRSLSILWFASWPENNFRNLVHICLSDQMSQPGGRPEERHWKRSFLVSFLNDSPCLEELVLSYTYALTDDGSTSSLHLPRLKMLILNMWDARSIVLFLSALELPASCLVQVSSTDPSVDLMSALCAGRALANMSGHMQHLSRLCLHFPYYGATDPILLACGKAGLYFKVTPSWDNGNQFVPLPISAEMRTFYSAMDIRELRIDVDLKKLWPSILGDPLPSTSSASWRQFYAMVPNVEKLVLVARGTPNPPLPECLDALRSLDGSSLCLPGLAELHLIFSGDISSEPLSIVQQVKADREVIGSPISRLFIGAQPPLVLYEETILDIREKLGPEVICGTQEVSFNWSPFSEWTPYPRYYWPEQLYGDSPGLWSDRTYHF